MLGWMRRRADAGHIPYTTLKEPDVGTDGSTPHSINSMSALLLPNNGVANTVPMRTDPELSGTNDELSFARRVGAALPSGASWPARDGPGLCSRRGILTPEAVLANSVVSADLGDGAAASLAAIATGGDLAVRRLGGHPARSGA